MHQSEPWQPEEPDEWGELGDLGPLDCPRCFRLVALLPYRGTLWGYCRPCGIYWFAALVAGELVSTMSPVAVERIFAANERINPPELG